MDIVFLIYGSAFLAMGLAIVVCQESACRADLADILWLLAAFGFTHGIVEWLGLWRVVRGDSQELSIMRGLGLLVSYLFLFEFGRRLMGASLRSAAAMPGRDVLASAGWGYIPILFAVMAGTAMAPQRMLALEIWTRYLVGFAGSTLVGAAFLHYAHRRLSAIPGESRMSSVQTACRAAGVAFLAYGVLGGLIVPRADWLHGAMPNEEVFLAKVHIPVQLFRTACAVVAGIAVTVMLKIFHLETVKHLKENEQKLKLGAQVIASALNGIMVTDSHNKVELVNPAFTKITGYTSDEIVGKEPDILKSGYHSSEFYAEMWQSLNRTGEWAGEIWNRRRNGEVFPEWLAISAIRDGQGLLSHYVGIFTDISRRKQLEYDLQRMAFHDPLTGLANRALFFDRLSQELRDVTRYGGYRVAVMYVDLDQFKLVNDVHGHEAGDLLLQQVANRLSAAVRNVDTVARLGGDEFAIVLTHIADAAVAVAVAGKIVTLLAEPFQLGQTRCQVSASIGIALGPDNGADADSLVKEADRAMYDAKRGGRNQVRFAPEQAEASGPAVRQECKTADIERPVILAPSPRQSGSE